MGWGKRRRDFGQRSVKCPSVVTARETDKGNHRTGFDRSVRLIQV